MHPTTFACSQSRSAKTAIALGIFALTLGSSASAMWTPQRIGAPIKHLNLSKKGLALDGFDPVAYFPEAGSKAKKGKTDLAIDFRGVTYRFATAKNQELFRMDPERFEPRYGGWCAWAMTKNEKVEIDPESFVIENGYLHVFYDGFFNDTRKSWKKQGGGELRPAADKNWGKMIGRKQDAKMPKRAKTAKLGMDGKDPVAQVNEQQALPGLAPISTRIGDHRWRFASKANQLAFLKNPAMYLPKMKSAGK